jgi:hypothetical protein
VTNSVSVERVVAANVTAKALERAGPLCAARYLRTSVVVDSHLALSVAVK